MNHIDEQFVAYLWLTKAFVGKPLKTTDGQKLTIAKWGVPSSGSGPDILHASVHIDGIQWHGKIEFHVIASDWSKHGHNTNDRYDNVILHVVWDEDKSISNRLGQVIPCLALKSLIDPALVDRYLTLSRAAHRFIPCEYHWPSIEHIHKANWKERMLLSKMEKAYGRILDIYYSTQKNLKQTFFVYCLRYFGLPTNQDNMQALAERLPWTLLSKHSDQLKTLEALLFGQANLLHKQDDYAKELQREYLYYQNKYGLKPMPKDTWHFSGMRPASFPSLRLAQMAAIVNKGYDLVDEISNLEDLTWIEKLKKVEPAPYWRKTYTFGSSSKPNTKFPGRQFLQLFIINAAAPLSFFLGKLRNEEEPKQNALNILRQLPSEKNKILRNWNKVGAITKTAYDSQALIYLYQHYCSSRRCASCAVGHQLLMKK